MPDKIHVLLADDDMDDRFFFKKVLEQLPFNTRLTTLEDGEKLIRFLATNQEKLPAVLFLDLNMPRKNGQECLLEIKRNPKWKSLPVVIYSTSMHEDVADLLYEGGAHYYMRKTDMGELEKTLSRIMTWVSEGKFVRPDRKHFPIMPLV